MADDRLHIAFLWHMHQPYYREASSGQCFMPWARLHATKDYHFMPALLRDYPKIKGNFNLVPSLLKQLQLYTQGASDAALDLSRIPATELSRKDRITLLHTFFFANVDHMIQPHPAFADLYARRGVSSKDEDLESRLALFSDQDFLDLQVWYNLVWIDPLQRERRPELKALMQKGHGFTEEEKALVLTAQAEVLQQVIPIYRELQAAGQIEVMTSPFYHPILPLLCDTEVARESMPHIQLPERFAHPEDAREQINRAKQYFENLMGVAPVGMWPSEGSVSPQAAELIASAGLHWIATDEEILAESLAANPARFVHGQTPRADYLYRPYRLELPDGKSLQMIFRDHELSDQIGFVYSGWDAKEAAANFMQRLRNIRESLHGKPGPHLVSVILDGENAWEYYPHNGEDFLRCLYEQLSEADDLVTVRVNDYLQANPAQETLPRLFAGSWINHNFRIWIGHPEDNTSWNYLSRTRQDLVDWERSQHEPKSVHVQAARAAAWEGLYIAEGSDWNWWYGDDHSSSLDMEFDQLYRDQLMAVYRTIGKPIPDYLLLPIHKEHFLPGTLTAPTGLLSPTIDGKVTDYFEWQAAGFVDAKSGGGAMHQAESAFQALYFGFDLTQLYLRIDFNPAWLAEHPIENFEIGIRFLEPSPHLARVRSLFPLTAIDFYRLDEQQRWQVVKSHGLQGAVRRIAELSVPFRDLDAGARDEVRFWVFLKIGDKEVERFPRQGPVSIKVPDEMYASSIWTT